MSEKGLDISSLLRTIEVAIQLHQEDENGVIQSTSTKLIQNQSYEYIEELNVLLTLKHHPKRKKIYQEMCEVWRCTQ